MRLAGISLLEMENEHSQANTPSKLRQPKVRKSMTAITPEAAKLSLGMQEPQVAPEPQPTLTERGAVKRRLESPNTTRNKSMTLPAAIPAPTLAGDRMVKTYKTAAAATGRPTPVLKPFQRAPPKTAATGRVQLPRTTVNSTDQGQRGAWEKSVSLKSSFPSSCRVVWKRWKR
jgi:hypothetical protein